MNIFKGKAPKKAITILVSILYCFFFVYLHNTVGPRIAALAVVPTIFVGLLYGAWAGALSGVIYFIINMPLYLIIGENALPDFITSYSGATIVEQLSVVAIGAAVGRMHDLTIKSRRTLRELEVVRKDLHEANTQLEKRVKARTSELLKNNEQLNILSEQRLAMVAALEYRFKLEKLVASISTNFIKLSLNDIDTGINSALESIGNFIEADRLCVFFINENATQMDMNYEWSADGIKAQIDSNQGIDINSFPWLMGKLYRYEYVHIPDPAELPHEATAEKEIFTTQRIKSIVAVPIIYGEKLRGLLSFINIRAEKTWMEEDIVLIQALGDIFINALERKKAEELKDIERLKTEFLTNITHEFRTPLTLAMGPLEELLHNNYLENNQLIKEQIEMSLRNTRKMLHLVNQLLDYSSLEAGVTILGFQKKNLMVFVSAIMDSFSVILSQKRIGSETTFTEDNFEAYIDPEKMDKVLVNVIGNAVKFTPEGGRLEISCRVIAASSIKSRKHVFDYCIDNVSEYIEIAVKDNGIGIKEEEIGKIFERFYHGSNSNVSGVKGTGIGLALTRDLLEVQYGHIDVESKYGKGTTIRLFLPKGKDHIENENLINVEGGQTEIPKSTKEYLDLFDLDETEEQLIPQQDKETVLVVDDNIDVRKHVTNILQQEYPVITAKDGKDALEKIERYNPSIIISDIMMPRMDGLQFFEKLKSNPDYSSIPFIFLTAKTDMEVKLSGLELGADDYLVKPFNSLELKIRVKNLLRNRELMRDNLEKQEKISLLTRSLEMRYKFENIVGKSKLMEDVFQKMELAKSSEQPILITGETGTGKDLIAKALHQISLRNEKPFIVLNCSTFSENLMESEMFGHVKGSFTGATQDKKGFFELANGGTLFLDEVGDLPLKTQAKLLRVLEDGTFYPLGGVKEKKVDVRLIAATNKNLDASIAKETFRNDLYYRLNVINIILPPLRERKEDILPLLAHFLENLEKINLKKKQFTQQSLTCLLDYTYPGNIRELRNIVDKAYTLCPTTKISIEYLPEEVRVTSKPEELFASLSEAENKNKRQLIVEALTLAKKNKTKTAQLLNTTRPTLYKLMKKYEIDLDSI